MPLSPSDRILSLYQDHAAAWDRLRGTGLIERAWLSDFLATLPSGGRDVLDIGCGTGVPIAAHLIDQGCRVTGIDGAAALIERAKDRFPEQLWITADMRALPPLGRFHGLIAWHSLFHLTPEDQRPMFATFRHLVVPGGLLMFTSGTTHGEVIGQFEGQPLYHGSLDRAEYQNLLQHNGFEVLRYVENDTACGGANVWLAKHASDQAGPR